MEANSLGIFHKLQKIEDLELGGKYIVTIRFPFEYGWIEHVKVVIESFGERNAYQMHHIYNEEEYAYFETSVYLETQSLEYHYYFSYIANGQFKYYKKENKTGDTSISIEECWSITVGFEVPNWAKGAIMYHIFVDRFCKGRVERLKNIPNRSIHTNWDEEPVIEPDEKGRWNIDFYGGDLIGIINKLKYIKSLGVDILYLSPIMKSQSNHRYDTADYTRVDPYVGSKTHLRILCEEAHKLGMKVILDAVFNHTGNDSKYFNEYGTYCTLGAYQSEKSPYYNFYKKELKDGKVNFSFWWGNKNLPECDGNSIEWKKYICGENGIIDHWFKLGIDGLRLDVADELTDEFIELILKASKRNKPDAFIIGEVWKNPMRMNRGYISSGKGMHTVMNYKLIDALIRYYKYGNVWLIDSCLREILAEYPTATIQTLMNFTSTHDISRIIEIFGCDVFIQTKRKEDDWGWDLIHKEDVNWIKSHKITSPEYKKGKKLLKSYVFALNFLPGIFSIFYGDEVGMQGIGNLLNRGPYPWNRRDKDLLRFFKRIGKIRKKHQFLKTASLNIVSIDEKMFVFERISESEEEKVIIYVSRINQETEINLPQEYQDAQLIETIKSTKKMLAPYGAIALKA